jgi:hypothetical protein
MTSLRRPTAPVPLQPAHRRDWRTLWRRCTCGLKAPCVDRLVPATPRPFPPRAVGRATGRTHAPSTTGARGYPDVRGPAEVRNRATEAGRAGGLTPGQSHRAHFGRAADSRLVATAYRGAAPAEQPRQRDRAVQPSGAIRPGQPTHSTGWQQPVHADQGIRLRQAVFPSQTAPLTDPHWPKTMIGGRAQSGRAERASHARYVREVASAGAMSQAGAAGQAGQAALASQAWLAGGPHLPRENGYASHPGYPGRPGHLARRQLSRPPTISARA